MLATSESRNDSDSKNVSYQRRLKPWKSWSERLELEREQHHEGDRREQEQKEQPGEEPQEARPVEALRGPAPAPGAPATPVAAVGGARS